VRIVRRDATEIAFAAAQLIRAGDRADGRIKVAELSADRIRDDVIAVYRRTLARDGVTVRAIAAKE
jgi:hypothetical protein